MHKILLGSLLFIISLTASAINVAGETVPEKIQVDEQQLVLNGAGSRVMARIFHVYVIALYLPEKKHAIEDVLAETVAKRLTLNFLFDGKTTQLLDATHKLLVENHSEEELKKLDIGWKEFAAPFETLTDIHKGDQYSFDYNPKTGMKISVNEKMIGQVTELGFMRAFLKVWLGDKPAQADLKDRLMGLDWADAE